MKTLIDCLMEGMGIMWYPFCYVLGLFIGMVIGRIIIWALR